jgi:hypothetical protein
MAARKFDRVMTRKAPGYDRVLAVQDAHDLIRPRPAPSRTGANLPKTDKSELQQVESNGFTRA